MDCAPILARVHEPSQQRDEVGWMAQPDASLRILGETEMVALPELSWEVL